MESCLIGLANIAAAPKNAIKVPEDIFVITDASIANQVIVANAIDKIICIRGEAIAFVDSNFKL